MNLRRTAAALASLRSIYHSDHGFWLTWQDASGSVGAVDAITREAILTLTKRVADLEAAVEVHRTMLKEAMHGQANATGTSFNAAAFDTQMTEAVLEQREKMALGVAEAPSAPPVLIIADPSETT